MLDAETKRKIDSTRDTLVGKVADPKAQVDQITNALIYKFMDDMDKKAQDLGGRATFFINNFEKYSWTKLLDKKLSGYERLNLYEQAITGMSKNPHIPQLFRDIFKDAVLPYRDPETLSLFLKEIDRFSYDHSENLGDVFEYLLSVLGSQGDAGQFRTPRHIIDFIVNIVDPKKNETILDPACGTAGFLISAYNHILRQYDGKYNKGTSQRAQRNLSPGEKQNIMKNFAGYDITPDMVKLSLVNMYLHGFADPHIFEYDTLTNEDRWNELATVILANPPFMTPKGGIRPHRRFSIQCNRSEVLFVDYIAEHLTPSGRAGIIVPEGIVFQSQNAYKQLRKMLVEEYLVVVISLPAGVFKPYSGVKTSILLLDRLLAKKSEYVGFFKVENDGFQLGDKRLPINQNDLPEAQAQIGEYLRLLRTGKSLDDLQPTLGLIVKKEKIASDDEFSLIGERYKSKVHLTTTFPHVPLKTVATITAGNSAPQGAEYFEGGKFPFIRTSDVGAIHRSDDFAGARDKVNQKAINNLRLRLFPPGTILFPKSGASTFLNHRVTISEAAYVASHLACIICDEKKALSKYIYNVLCLIDAKQIAPDQDYPSLRLTTIENIKIPLPPLEIQKEIVEQIKIKQNAINHAKEIIKNLERERDDILAKKLEG